MSNLKKVIKVLINTLMTLILVVGVTFIVLYLVGIEPYVVETGSMQPTIKAGSLSFVNKNVKYENIKQDDIIAFKTPAGDQVTHRAIHITRSGIETKGDSNNLSDGITTTSENYIGKNIFSIPKIGHVVQLLQTTKGKIILIVLIIVILVAGFLFDTGKKGKNAELKKTQNKKYKIEKDAK